MGSSKLSRFNLALYLGKLAREGQRSLANRPEAAKLATMSGSLCNTCTHVREIISGKGSRFLLCGLSQTDGRYAKYPPQPVARCTGFEPIRLEDDTVTGDAPKPNTICLDQFLKLTSIAESGGQAKVMIQGGQVKVNGELETRRRRKLTAEDVIEVGGGKWLVKDVVSLK